MQKRQDLKFGAILEFVLGMKRQESFNILCKGIKIYSNLTEEEYFNTMEDLSVEFYQTGSPRPEELETEIIGEN
jgi:hypothetical protein